MKNGAFIDMEGVLIPEIWPYLAECLGLKELKITTRDVPDYNYLMKTRIECLKNNNVTFETVKELVDKLNPFTGADKFIQSLKDNQYEVNIVSDSFYQLLGEFFKALDILQSSTHCHHLVIDNDGFINSINYTRTRGKHEVVNAQIDKLTHSIAVGDAFNDFSMLEIVDKGFLFSPSDTVRKLAPTNIHVVYDYNDIILSMNEINMTKLP